jgi:hypothetical protein
MFDQNPSNSGEFHDPRLTQHLVESLPRRRTTAHDAMDHIFNEVAVHTIAYYTAYIVTYFLYGAVIGGISLFVYELFLNEGDLVRFGVTLGVAGIITILIGLFFHPWMRTHLPKKEL